MIWGEGGNPTSKDAPFFTTTYALAHGLATAPGWNGTATISGLSPRRSSALRMIAWRGSACVQYKTAALLHRSYLFVILKQKKIKNFT